MEVVSAQAKGAVMLAASLGQGASNRTRRAQQDKARPATRPSAML